MSLAGATVTILMTVITLGMSSQPRGLFRFSLVYCFLLGEGRAGDTSWDAVEAGGALGVSLFMRLCVCLQGSPIWPLCRR